MDNLITWPYVRKEEEERLRQLDREKQRRIQELPPLPLRILPLPREDLASVLSRAARRMGYEKPEWLLRLESVPHKINPDNLPLLHRQKDYLLLKRLLLLEEEEIYALTLHCFAQHFSQDVWLLSAMHKDVQQSINRAGLSYEYGHQFFLTQRYTKVCPLCLDEEDGYGRLFWRCTLILYCPRHRVLLVHSCPTCKGPIPALRPSLTLCPACKTGDYRMCLHPILPEDLWLESGHRSLLRHLGIDEAEVGTPLVASEETALERLPTYDYFVVLSICLSFSKLYSLSDERISRFLVRELPLEMVETRFTQSLGRSSHENLSPILIHYLSSAWPLHVLAFLKCLQRLLQEAFHYAPQSAVVQRWSQAIVQGNYWCALSYREQPVSQLMNLYRVCEQRFKSLPVAEREEDYQGGEVVNERLILKREAEITPLDKAILPHHWESLPSIMARVADVMGYRRTEGLWKEPPGNAHRQSFMPDEVLLLKRNGDYHFLQHMFLLDEMTIYSLTLHRFASRFQSSNQPAESPALWSVVERPLLSGETAIRHCLPTLTTKVCPACLEQDGYERLYWNIRWVLICPYNHLFLVDRCPNCHWLIPAIRRAALSACPYCGRGDYRAVKQVTVAQDSLLSMSQLMVLHELGVDVQRSQNVPPLFQNTPLALLHPWEYFDVLYYFGSVFLYLRPERTLTSLCGLLGLPDVRSLYEGLEDHRTAIQVSLFHALCMSWPDQLHATLHGAISHSRFNEQDGGLPLLDGSSEHLSVALKQLFVETQAMYTQQALQRRMIRAGIQRKT